MADDSVEIVRYLLDAGADLEHANNKGETPLNIAVGNTTSGAGEIIQFLRDRGADPYRPANNGVSAIDYLRRIGNEDKRAPFADLL
ncbi:putative ankyrin-like protein [Mycobacteroides abscessus subsp. abscessus]|nr:putative ankyrin-like protein [Mycobacteroides abscessus subsp. abscessus]